MPARRVLQSVPETGIFTLELPELDPEPPIFHLAAAHTYTKIWGECPPPPRAPGPCLLQGWIHIHGGGGAKDYYMRRTHINYQREALGFLMLSRAICALF